MSVLDPDPILRRLERTALVFCGLAAVVALGVRRGQPDVALGILGGGALTGLSYWAIRSSIDGLVALMAGRDGAEHVAAPGPVSILLRLAGRYALLALLAYGMIARLRLDPVGLLIGVSSLVVAASLEAARAAGGRRRDGPRA